MYTTQEYLDMTYTDDNAVLRWESSDRVPPSDIVDAFFGEGLIPFCVYAASTKTREEETAAIIENYRRNFRYSDEDLAEMRAAFGSGETVVNVFTGKTITL